MTQSNKWCLALVLITALWGWSFVAIHDAMSAMSPATFNALRFTAGALVLLVIIVLQRRTIDVKNLRLSLLAGLSLTLAFAFQTTGIAHTTASNAGFITGLAVVFTPMFAYMLLKSKPTPGQALGAIIALLGLGLLTLKGVAVHMGDALVLACAAFTALHIIITSRLDQGCDVLFSAFVQVSTVAVLSLAWSLYQGDFLIPEERSILFDILIIGFIGTALAYFIQTKAQTYSLPSKIALILVLEPVFGGIFGYFLAGDRLTTINMIGAALIIIGMVVTEWNWKVVNKVVPET